MYIIYGDFQTILNFHNIVQIHLFFIWFHMLLELLIVAFSTNYRVKFVVMATFHFVYGLALSITYQCMIDFSVRFHFPEMLW